MPFLQTYLCGRGHETEHLHMGQRGNAPDKLLCFHCLEASKKDAARLSEDPIADGFSSDLLTDEELRLRISKVMCEMSAEEVRFLPVEIRRAAIHRDSLYGISHQRGTLRMWRVRHNEEMMLFNHSILAFPVISTSAAPITINRRNGDYAAREKERLTKRSKEYNRLKTSREEADANTERVVGKDTANVLFAKGLHA